MAGTGVTVLTGCDALAIEDPARLKRFAAVVVLAAHVHQTRAREIAQQLGLEPFTCGQKSGAITTQRCLRKINRGLAKSSRRVQHHGALWAVERRQNSLILTGAPTEELLRQTDKDGIGKH